jgi:DNA polymerase-3 subunit alpha
MGKPEFTHLHNHSDFSLLDGLQSIKEMTSKAHDHEMTALALTDHGSCAGLLEFQKSCVSKSIKPILGMEAYVCPDRKIQDKSSAKSNHLILLAKNRVGYQNLIKLSSLSYLEGFYYKPRIDFDLLTEYHEGLIVSTGCCIGEIPSLFYQEEDDRALEVTNQYRELFGDDFYIEIMMHKYFDKPEQEAREKLIAKKLYALSKKTGIKAICTQDAHYSCDDDFNAHDVLLSIQTLDNIKNPKRFTYGSGEFYLKAQEDMARLYNKAPELLINTMEITEKVEGSNLIETGRDLSPDFKLPEGFQNGEEYLKALVSDGMKVKGLYDKKKYRDRVKYEMSVIITCNYTMYFLILWDIINFARSNKIRIGCGRGSAVSSLCLYVLGITKVDPIKQDLIFERFLNPERISPPDVDIDFDYDRRIEIYNYITRTYGADYCSQIGVYQTFKARAALGRAAKAMDIGKDWEYKLRNPKAEVRKNSMYEADRLSKLIPLQITDLKEAIQEDSDLRTALAPHPELVKNALTIEGKISSASIHPAGVLVSRLPVIDVIPLRVSKGVICSQYTGPEVEEIGLIKYDILALKTLTVVDRTLEMVKDRRGIEFDIDELVPDDTGVFAMLNGEVKNMDTKGIFQFESYRISQLLADIKVDTFEDMVVTNALFRPGPLGSGVHEDYVAYKHGYQDIKYLHPKMGEVLHDTYGIMIYQESIMKVAQHLAGFTFGQADILRKVVGKKKPELIKKEKIDVMFREGCVKNGISAKVADAIFAQIYEFSGYGFNKCLSGDTKVYNKADGQEYMIGELEEIFFNFQLSAVWNETVPSLSEDVVKPNIVLDSYVNGGIVEDEVVDVFETGEKEVFEIELENGSIIKSTLDHKFLCSDGEFHTVQHIMDEDLEIMWDEICKS